MYDTVVEAFIKACNIENSKAAGKQYLFGGEVSIGETGAEIVKSS